MRKIECGNGNTTFSLPGIADERALIPIADELLASGGNRAMKLDFGGTSHIDYRAFRRFVRQVRRLESLARPIVLAGLNPYCAAILKFALATNDWDLFTETASGNETVASLGIDAAVGIADSRPVPRPGLRRINLFLEPCPN